MGDKGLFKKGTLKKGLTHPTDAQDERVYRGITHVIAVMVLLAVLLFSSVFSSIPTDPSHYMELANGWTVTVGGETYENVTITDFEFPMQQKGNVVTLSTRLPMDVMENPLLIFVSVHSAMDVYVDGMQVFSYGWNYAAKNLELGYGLQCISLPSDYNGRMLTIKLYVTESSAFNFIDLPLLYDANYYFRDTMRSNLKNVLVDVFFVVFGTSLFIIGVIFALRDKKYYKIVCISLFSIAIGLWSLCYSNLIMMMIYNLRVKTYLEYISLYVSPLIIMLYFYDDTLHLEHKWVRKQYLVILWAQMAFDCLWAVLVGINLAHFPDVLGLSHFLILLSSASILIVIVDFYRIKENRNQILAFGILMALVFVFADVFTFNIRKFTSIFGDHSFTSISNIGVLIFIFAVILDFVTRVSEEAKNKIRANMLEEIAYIDPLTGLFSRRKYEEECDRFFIGAEYGVLLYDLNNLKKINDVYGHAAGDQTIKRFARCLRESCKDRGIIARIGGDEFVVLFKEGELPDIGKLTEEISMAMIHANQENPDYNLSAAWGYCSSTEQKGKAYKEVYAIADQRMYECKKRMGSER